VSVKDAEGNVIQEAPLPVWANLQQRALDVAITQINKKTDLRIKLASIERSRHRRVVALSFTIKTQPIPKGATRLKKASLTGPPRSKRSYHSTSEYPSASVKENS
jgi:hypothetical protein